MKKAKHNRARAHARQRLAERYPEYKAEMLQRIRSFIRHRKYPDEFEFVYSEFVSCTRTVVLLHHCTSHGLIKLVYSKRAKEIITMLPVTDEDRAEACETVFA